MASLHERGSGIQYDQVKPLILEDRMRRVEGEELHPVTEEAQRGNDVLSRGVAQKRNTVHVLSLPTRHAAA